MKTLRFSVFALVLGVATVACGDDESAPAASSAKISTALLEYVPGDTPFVFAALEPQPAALQEKFEPMLEMAVDQYHNLFLQARTAMTKGDDESASDDLINVLDVLIEETEDGDLAGLGFDSRKDVPVIYGHGLLPVVRMTISDPDAWASTYSRLTADLEHAPTPITVDGLASMTLVGIPVNFAPTFTSTPPASTPEDAAFSYSITAADLDGDGAMDVAFIDRPHLAKTLRIWRYENATLTQVAALRGVTNHRIGEVDIAGGIRTCNGTPEMLLASANWSDLVAVRWGTNGFTQKRLGSTTTRAAFGQAMACTD